MRPRSIAVLATLAVTAAALDASPATAGKQSRSGRPATGGPAGVDVRASRAHDVRPDSAQQAEIRSLRPATVQWNRAHGTPASIARTRGYLTTSSGAGAEQVARGFLAEHQRL